MTDSKILKPDGSIARQPIAYPLGDTTLGFAESPEELRAQIEAIGRQGGIPLPTARAPNGAVAAISPLSMQHFALLWVHCSKMEATVKELTAKVEAQATEIEQLKDTSVHMLRHKHHMAEAEDGQPVENLPTTSEPKWETQH